MIGFNLSVTCFILTCVFYSVRGEECVYDDSGNCISSCPPDTHSYTPNCDEEAMSQRTCLSPVARTMGPRCDYSRCDCEEPKVWDEADKQCVLVEDCPTQSQE